MPPKIVELWIKEITIIDKLKKSCQIQELRTYRFIHFNYGVLYYSLSY